MDEIRGSRDIDLRAEALHEAQRAERARQRRWPNVPAAASLPLVIVGYLTSFAGRNGSFGAWGIMEVGLGYALALPGLLSARRIYRGMALAAIVMGLPFLPILAALSSFL